MGNDLLFVHANRAWDSTVRIFGIGKKLVFRKLIKPVPIMKSRGSSILLPNKSKEEISNIDKCVMVDLFGGKSDDSVEWLRQYIFTVKVATAETFVTPERLNPTSHATVY